MSIEPNHERDIEQCGTEHSTDRRRDRDSRAARGMQRSAGRGRFHDLLRRESEEKGHCDVVHPEMHRRCPALVAFEINVGPEETEHGAQDEQPGVIDEPTHGLTIVGLATHLVVLRSISLGKVVTHRFSDRLRVFAGLFQ